MKQLQILVVEDEGYIQDLIKVAINVALEGCCFTIQTLNNGKDAFEKLKKSEFDLCFFDINLPGYNGLELLTYLRQLNRKEAVYVISAEITQEHINTSYRLGITDFIKKPFTIHEVTYKIETFISQYIIDGPVDVSSCEKVPIDSRSYFVPSCKKVFATKDDKEIVLNEHQSLLLAKLVENQNRCVSTHDLFEAGWGENVHISIDVVRKNISLIKSKLFKTKAIKIRRAQGWILEVYQEL